MAPPRKTKKSRASASEGLAALEQFAKGEFPPLIHLYGDETFLRERAVQAAYDQLVDPGMVEFCFDRFSGGETTGSRILTACQTLPMFTQRRLVLVREADNLKADETKVLESYLASPVASTVLLLDGRKKGQTKFWKEFGKHGLQVEFGAPRYANQAVPLLQNQIARPRGWKVDADAAALLIDLVGMDLAILERELERIALFIGGDEPRIGINEVESLVLAGSEVNAGDLALAIVAGRAEKALGMLHRVMGGSEARARESSGYLTAVIAGWVRLLLRMRSASDRGEPMEGFRRSLGPFGWQVPRLEPYLNRYELTVLMEFIDRLKTIDLKIKTGGPPQLLLEELILWAAAPPTRR